MQAQPGQPVLYKSTSSPGELHTGVTDLSVFIYYIVDVLYILLYYKLSSWITNYLKKPHKTPLRSFKDLSRNRDRQKRLLFVLC